MYSLSNEPDGLQVPNALALLPRKTKNLDDGLIELTDALEAIDENSSMAKINATSISDNNGSRIFL